LSKDCYKTGDILPTDLFIQRRWENHDGTLMSVTVQFTGMVKEILELSDRKKKRGQKTEQTLRIGNCPSLESVSCW
jgi:hypothetical protein